MASEQLTQSHTSTLTHTYESFELDLQSISSHTSETTGSIFKNPSETYRIVEN